MSYKYTGKNYYSKPIYEIKNIPHRIVLLALIARGGRDKISRSYSELLLDWEQFVPHLQAYDMMVFYITKKLRGRVKRIKKNRRSEVMITNYGLKTLKYYDEKVGLPPVLKDPIKHLLDRVEL